MKRSQRERPHVALAVTAHGDGPVLGLAVADDEHVGDLAQLGLADLAPDRLGALVDLGAQPAAAQPAPAISSAASTWRSEIGSTIACIGASQTGNSPAKCSSRIPMKRSKEPMRARWIITGRCSALSAPV